MNTQNINVCYSKEQWLTILNDAFCSRTHFEGHMYIYFNQDGYIDSFYFPKVNQKIFYNEKMDLRRIIWLTQKYFKDYQQCHYMELWTLRRAFEFIRQGGQSACHECINIWFNFKVVKKQQLIEAQLERLIKQQIYMKHQQLQAAMNSFHTIVKELNDIRFTQAYYLFVSREKKWHTSFQQSETVSYEDWKNQKKELSLLLSQLQKFIYFSDRVLSIAKQKRILYYLLLLHPPYPVCPSTKIKTVTGLEQVLNDLINQRISANVSEIILQHLVFDIDERDEDSRFDNLDSDLEKWQFSILQDARNQTNDHAFLTDKIIANEIKLDISPLKNFNSFCKEICKSQKDFLIFKENAKLFLSNSQNLKK